MMKQVQQMQSQMQKSQAELAALNFEATVAGGKVVITANFGLGEVHIEQARLFLCG